MLQLDSYAYLVALSNKSLFPQISAFVNGNANGNVTRDKGF